MTEQRQPDGGRGASGQDPWAPPQGPSLHKKDQTPPSVHDQATMAAMPSVGPGPQAGPTVPPQQTGPNVPPPPVGPNGPGVPAPPVGYGYPGQPGYPGPQSYAGGPQGYPGGPQGYPTGPQGYPQPPAYGWGAPMGPVPQNNAGTAALVLGILSIVLFCLYGVASLILGVIAVILGVQGRRRADRGEATNRGQAQAGFVLGIIGIIVGVVTLALFIGILVFAAHKKDSRQDDDPFGSSYNSAPQLPGSPGI
ncbi:DUF4190 domain-containing protein [Streptomyces bauhiniae]